ncbi:hypothetical protein [Sediminibacterium sp. TEGAF015]|uniref:hypothetical protein n=1 Tax=Sediminibacterium sp. TEGAF015 TaxID=575378 RepID=UPI002230A878|nr:hypothetical protein [Sediminibacterium sp. TEGAF015]
MHKYFYLFCSFLLSLQYGFGQQSDSLPVIPAMRQLHHEYIIRSWDAIRSSTEKHQMLTEAEQQQAEQIVFQLRNFIERSELIDNNGKYTWLRGVNEILTGLSNNFALNRSQPTSVLQVLQTYQTAMLAQLKGESIAPLMKFLDLESASLFAENIALASNPGQVAVKDSIIVKQCVRNPERILPILVKNPATASADTLIIQAAYRNPEELYSYAAAPNALGKKIQSVKHQFVKIVAQLALTSTGRMYFPFLDQLYTGKLKMDSITRFVGNDTSSGYYSLLVRTRIDYAKRIQAGDTPMASKVLIDKLKSKGVELYINEINALHNENSDAVRFKIISRLSPQELYYLAVTGEEDLYTSSFVNGVYPRIFSGMKVPRADSILKWVNYDYYKKFIKIAAAYNKLDDFLGKMDKQDAEKLMKGFVNGLEKTNSLEDAVDVADSYASIYNPSLKQLMLSQVRSELKRCIAINNKRGKVIYELLETIFSSLEPNNKIDLSAKLGIMPVYELPNQLLRDETNGRVVMQQFFYGDKDGMVIFNAFLSRFRNANWKITRKSQWVEVSSRTGVPVTIYANLPLDETEDLDTQSQDSLIAYLNEQKLHPSVVIHRGHSYYLNQTVHKMPSSAKLVLLGSCGGYQRLNEVLEIAPGAHIISSKQIGTGVINQGLINVISEDIRLGKNLKWPNLWNNLAVRFNGSAKEKFDDYVPPHKNLGAIFITAFNTAMQQDL